MDEESRKVILARRARFIAAALAGVGLAGQACGGEAHDPNGDAGAGPGGGTAGAQPCLSIVAGTFNVGGAQPCLQPPLGGTPGVGGRPQPCLTGGAPFTSGSGGQVTSGGRAGAGGSSAGAGGTIAGVGGVCLSGAAGVPQPCLQPPLAGTGGVGGAAGETGWFPGGAGGEGGQKDP